MNISEIKIDNKQSAMIIYKEKLFRMLIKILRMLITYFKVIKIENFVNNYQSFFCILVDAIK